MAAFQSLHKSSYTSQTWISNSSSSSSTSTSRMNDLPSQLSPPQLEAQQILQHLLSKLKDPESRYYARYGRWLERHPRLDDFCLRCIRPQVWTYLNGRWSLDALKLIGGDLRSDTRAISASFRIATVEDPRDGQGFRDSVHGYVDTTHG